MTSPTTSYRKPITASGSGFAVKPIDRAYEDEEVPAQPDRG